MALRDQLIAALGVDIDAAASSDLPEAGLACRILPANGPGDWSGGYVVAIEVWAKGPTKSERGTMRINWTSPAIPAAEKPDTDAVINDVLAVAKEIKRRRALRTGGD